MPTSCQVLPDSSPVNPVHPAIVPGGIICAPAEMGLRIDAPVVACRVVGAAADVDAAIGAGRIVGALSWGEVYSGKLTFPLHALAAGLGDHTIVTTLCPGGKERMRRLMQILASGRLDLRPLVTHRFTLDRTEEATCVSAFSLHCVDRGWLRRACRGAVP